MKADYLLFINLSFLLIHSFFCQNKTRFVYEVFRHGARAPLIDSYTTDMLGNIWDNGYLLTDIGRKQHFILGQIRRQKYSSFISDLYDSNEVYVTSTNTERTIDSAQSHLQGLYYTIFESGITLNAKEFDLSNPPNINLDQAIIDELLFLDASDISYASVINVKDNTTSSGSCTNNNNLYKTYNEPLALEISENFMNNWGDVMNKLYQIKNDNSYTTYQNLTTFSDQFISNYFNGNSMQILTNENVDIELMKVDALKFHGGQFMKYIYGSYENSLKSLLEGAAFYTSLLQMMDNRISLDTNNQYYSYSSPDSPKYKIYSCHDSTIAPYLGFLREAFNIEMNDYEIPFTSNLLFELSQNANNTYQIDVEYNGNLLLSLMYNEFKNVIKTTMLNETQINDFCNNRTFPKVKHFFHNSTIKNSTNSTFNFSSSNKEFNSTSNSSIFSQLLFLNSSINSASFIIISFIIAFIF